MARIAIVVTVLLVLSLSFAAGQTGPGGRPLLGAAGFKPSPEQPVGWRGDGTGVFPGATPPTQWDGPSGRNILWKAPMPHVTYSSPIVVGNKVITLADPQTILCLDADNGKLLWHNAQDQLDLLCKDAAEAKRYRRLWSLYQSYFTGVSQQGKLTPAQEAEKQQARKELEAAGVSLVTASADDRDPAWKAADYNPFFTKVGLWAHLNRGVPATLATPVSDGKYVWAWYKSNTAACYDLTDGKVVWMKFLGEVSGQADLFMSSPLLVDGVLIVFGDFTLRGLDPATGRELWKQSHKQRGCHHCDSSSSLVLMTLEGTRVVVGWGGEVYRASDGAVLSKGFAGKIDLPGRVVRYNRGNSPFMIGPDAICMQGMSNKPACRFDAWRFSASGDSVSDTFLWAANPKTFEADDGTSVYYDGFVYMNDGDDMIEVATGKVISRQLAMPAGGYSGVSVAGKYLINFDAVASAGVATLGPRGAVVSVNHLLPGYTHTDQWGGGNRARGSKACDEAFWKHVREQAAKGVIGWVGMTRNLVLGDMTAEAFFQGGRIYVRTYTHLYCIGSR